ncbi:hypothetical protein MACH09_45460 [Vibrio sp. MACH09]|uniref:hypothetical protein n=1 Tax=Vibrio sp. MACH09 TaxID=3025122 RepID=UPI00278F5BEE|nr:hypothetical protein [Vibrio sp. MACH09]GLO64038.1 hypothetical protein MACH09_45460 [Vibrio sp. MACH09]
MNSFTKQIKTVAFYLFSIAFWGGIALTVIYYISPVTMARITAFYDDNVSVWDETACEANQERCLEAKLRELESLRVDLDGGIQKLNEQIVSQGEIISHHILLQKANSQLITAGQAQVSTLSNPPSEQPIDIWFSGQHFSNINVLKSQLSLLEREKRVLASQVKQADNIKSQLVTTREKLIINRGELNLEIKMIPSKLILLRSSQFLQDFDQSVIRIDDLLNNGYSELKQVSDVILNTEEFVRQYSNNQ